MKTIKLILGMVLFLTIALSCQKETSTPLQISCDTQLPPNQSVQCNGITKSNTRCKNMTLNACGYCYLHVSQNK